MGFPGLCRCINRSTFQIFGIFRLFTARFMVSVRYLSVIGPGDDGWLKWIGAIRCAQGLTFLCLFYSFFHSVILKLCGPYF